MSRRNPGVSGLTYVEANGDRISRYTLSQDVIDARKRIERDYPNIRIWWDGENQEHCVCQIDGHGTETLVFATRTFHEDLIRVRLEKANNLRSDPFEEIEKHNAEVDRRQEAALVEKVHEAGEKLAHAFAQDGLTVRPRMIPISVKRYKNNRLRNFEAPSRTISNR